jgi:prephenate dehydrogenase
VTSVKFRRLAIIGCGLMGGSFALALRKAQCVEHIAGFSASSRSRQKARELGVIDEACDSIGQAVTNADLVLLAVPVSVMQNSFQAMAGHLDSNALVMDVGSTKSDVIHAAQNSLDTRIQCFVPAHPIAGKEVAGIEHAEATLYQNRRTILTPLQSNTKNQVDLAQQVWQAVGSNVSQMTAQEHDAVFAAVSHLPHLIAFAAVNAITQQTNSEQLLEMAGPGFRDFSRIAASDPTVWRDIFLANHKQVLIQLNAFEQQIQQFRQSLQPSGAQDLEALIAKASQSRGQWKLQSGPCSSNSNDIP